VAYGWEMRIADPARWQPTPAAPADRRTLIEEVLVVLSLSVLASAVYAVIDLLSAPLKGVYVAAGNQSNEFLKQILGFVFGLAPVYLVLHLIRRDGEGLIGIGLQTDRPRDDLARGAVLFLVVAAGGIAIYLGAVAVGVNRFVVPVPPTGHWWTVPALLLNAAQAALLEEIIVLGYLVTRLQQLRWAPMAAVVGAAVLRGSYHLYQGWGGFAGNLLMGLLFGLLFLRWRRTWPFVVAHFLLDVGAGVGFLLFRHHLPGFS
jgi:membrane protease YdiL (CAAX protease family)